MRSISSNSGSGMKVGEIVDAMHLSGEFSPLTRDNIFSVVEIFLREYVGMPGTIITKKFTRDSAKEVSERTNIPVDVVVKIVVVFRLRGASKGSSISKMVMSYLKPKVSGGGRGFIRRM